MELEKALISNPFYYSRKQIVKIKGIIEPTTRIKHSKLIGKIGSLLGLYVVFCMHKLNRFALLVHTIVSALAFIYTIDSQFQTLIFWSSMLRKLNSFGSLVFPSPWKWKKLWGGCRIFTWQLWVSWPAPVQVCRFSPLYYNIADTGATLGSGEVDPKVWILCCGYLLLFLN